MRTAIDVVLAKPEPTREELVSMSTDVRRAVDHAERLIEALSILAHNDQTRVLTDPVDLASVAEDALDRRTTEDVTTTSTLDEAPVTGHDGFARSRARLLDRRDARRHGGRHRPTHRRDGHQHLLPATQPRRPRCASLIETLAHGGTWR